VPASAVVLKLVVSDGVVGVPSFSEVVLVLVVSTGVDVVGCGVVLVLAAAVVLVLVVSTGVALGVEDESTGVDVVGVVLASEAMASAVVLVLARPVTKTRTRGVTRTREIDKNARPVTRCSVRTQGQTTQWVSQIGPFSFVAVIKNCSMQRYLINRHFDRMFWRNFLRSPLCGCASNRLGNSPVLEPHDRPSL
jgi:hypothetical protein